MQGDGRHGLGVVVGHLNGAVPLADVPVEQHAQGHTRQLMHGGNLLQVPLQLKGQEAQHAGRQQHGCTQARPEALHRPVHRRQEPHEGVRDLYVTLYSVNALAGKHSR